ncbi:hypothetical protein HYC85_020219 [Camellia sinensis]|uniref:Cytochrome c oxidase subunit 6b n=1 Tax=Camellia sinensis TaxID=4442 RepID=A0A7J7GQ12_CAMSI|nr:hypothetical protein HYC85_020219 [Camellia sinensis]
MEAAVPLSQFSIELLDSFLQYLLKEKEGKLDIATKPTEETEAKNPANSTFEEVITQEVEQTPEIKCTTFHSSLCTVVGYQIQTAPADFRFPTTNQTRHCFTRYIEYHRCVAARGDGASECNKFAKYYRSLCPGEWVERWNEQRENGIFPGPL